MNRIFANVFTATFIVTCCFATSKNGGDIEIVLPESISPKQDKEEQQHMGKDNTRSELIGRASQRLPYKRFEDGIRKFNTMGLLAKLCDAGMVATVMGIEKGDKQSSRSQVSPNITIVLGVETNLIGSIGSKSLTLSVNWWDRPRLPQKGDRLLIFITQEDYESCFPYAMEWDVDKTKLHAKSLNKLVMMGQSYGAVELNGGESERVILSAANGYAQLLRGNIHDTEKYYQFLCGLLQSPVIRIKNDATYDMLYFLKSCPSFDLNRVLDSKDVDEGIKDYVRLILLPSRQPQIKP